MKCPVFYRDEMVPVISSFSPSPGKPALVLQDWKRAGMSIDVRGFAPVSRAQLYLAHNEDYVDGIMDGTRRNGFGGYCRKAAESFSYTCGAMLSAALCAVKTGTAACAPVSGFHHAGPAYASGYCTFNGLMVAALSLKRDGIRDGIVERVGILDLDQHWGDGTDAIIKARQADWITHHSPGSRSCKEASGYLRRLPDLIKSMKGHSVLLYQAGADAHVGDPLGGWMTTTQLARRDRIVFETAAAIGLPVAWCLAGGYQRKPDGSIPVVLKIHRNTMRACCEAW